MGILENIPLLGFVCFSCDYGLFVCFYPQWGHFFSLCFRERGRERKKHWCKREASIGHFLDTGLNRNLGMCPDQESNLQPFVVGQQSNQLQIYFLFFIFQIFYLLFSEKGEGRKKERERNIDVQEKYQLVASHTPPVGNLAHNPGMCPRLGIKPATSWLAGQRTDYWATPARAAYLFFL